MKNIFTILLITISAFSFGQESFNKWSVDADFGMNKTWAARGLANKLSISSNVGVRYMLNNNFGLKLDLGYNRFQNKDKFNKTNLYSVTGFAVANIGHMLRFETFAKRLGLLAYVGAGSSFFSIDKFDIQDKMLLGTVGFTIQYKATSKLAINLNLSNTVNIMQDRNFDGTVIKSKRSLDGMYSHLGLGVSYYFGQEKEHADWLPTPTGSTEPIDNPRYEAYEKRIKALEDSLANKQEVSDRDGDGIPDEYDVCPDKKGLYSDNGCPDTDGDGVDDSKDKCPDVVGVHENDGCPEIDQEVYKVMRKALKGVQFETGKDVLLDRSLKHLDDIAIVLEDHPEYYININGYTDNVGTEESNKTLSVQRARAVTDYLVTKGVDVTRIHARGYGEAHPVASNETEAGQALNRRVDFKIVFE